MAEKLTQEQKAKAYKLLTVEYSDEQIAKSLGVNKILVERWRHAIGLPEGSGERVVTAGRKKAPAEEAPVTVTKLSDAELTEFKAHLGVEDKNADPEDYDAPADDVALEIMDIREEAAGFCTKEDEAYIKEVKKKKGRPPMKKPIVAYAEYAKSKAEPEKTVPKATMPEFRPTTIGQLRGILQDENDAALLVIGGRVIEIKEVTVRRQLNTGRVYVELMGDHDVLESYEAGANE